jgi:hypothetical protein
VWVNNRTANGKCVRGVLVGFCWLEVEIGRGTVAGKFWCCGSFLWLRAHGLRLYSQLAHGLPFVARTSSGYIELLRMTFTPFMLVPALSCTMHSSIVGVSCCHVSQTIVAEREVSVFVTYLNRLWALTTCTT